MNELPSSARTGGRDAVVVLVSGRGSNLRALAGAMDEGRCRGRIAGVVADRRRCDALHWAEGRGWPTRSVRPRDHEDREAWDRALANTVTELKPDLVVLAGFMRIVGPAMLEAWGGRIVNVHPSLLPAFPGMYAPEQAVAAGTARSGCSVHLVDGGVDTGPVLAQAACDVLRDDTPQTLHRRIQALEHDLLPRVVDSLLAARSAG